MTTATLNEDEELPRKYTKDEVLHKVDAEGGILEAIAYGITSDLLPDETPDAVVLHWYDIEKALTGYPTVTEWLYGNDVSPLSS